MKKAFVAACVIACAAGGGIMTSRADAQPVSDPVQMARFGADKQLLEQMPGLNAIPRSVLVKFNPSVPDSAVTGLLLGTRSAPVRTFPLVPGLVQLRTALPLDQAIGLLSGSPWVEFAEPDFVQRPVSTFPNDTYFGIEWGLHNTGQVVRSTTGVADADIDMPEAWDITTGSSSFVIADIDTGTQWSHPDLDANIWTNPGEIAGNGIDDDSNGYIDDVRGWDFYAHDANPDDESGHGTHTAGTIGAEGNNGTGVAGVNWSCKIMCLRFLGTNGGTTSDAVSAVQYAAAKGVKVSNNSWGGGGYSTALYSAIANARSVGHIFVAAAGNSAINVDSTPFYPAAYNLDNILSVAATNNRDGIASFSNYGATSVDLGAPGVDIASTYRGSSYAYLSGTSMATPHVTGVVALVYQRNTGFGYSQVIARILSTVRPIASLNGRCVTGGMLNAFAALQTVAPVNTPPAVNILSPTEGSRTVQGTTVSFSGSALDAQDGDLSPVIVWSSSINGQIGVGPGFSTTGLSLGTHTITASVLDSGNLGASASVSITIDPPGTPPIAPSGTLAVNNANGTATITWNDRSTNETSFVIERSRLNASGVWSGSTQFVVPANTTSFADAPGAGTFRYHVRARNASGNSTWSNWSQVTVTQ